jgi:hypothetical protein
MAARKRFVERIFFGVNRLPIAACGGAQDVIGYLDMVIAEVFDRLCPIADFRRIVANRAGREKSAEFHAVFVSVGGLTGRCRWLPACGDGDPAATHYGREISDPGHQAADRRVAATLKQTIEPTRFLQKWSPDALPRLRNPG